MNIPYLSPTNPNKEMPGISINQGAEIMSQQPKHGYAGEFGFVPDRLFSTQGTTLGKVARYTADLVSSSDYFPFGMQMPSRKVDSGKYRYGFNGKEKDNEGMGGGGSTYDYGFRIYNAQIAKFLSVDPLEDEYPMLSTYQFANNTPIQAIDLDGLEAASSIVNDEVLRKGLQNIPGNPGYRPNSTITEYAVAIGNNQFRIFKSYTNICLESAQAIDAQNQNGGVIRVLTPRKLAEEFSGPNNSKVSSGMNSNTGVGQNGEYIMPNIPVTNSTTQTASVSQATAQTTATPGAPAGPAMVGGIYTPGNTTNTITVPNGSSVTATASVQTGNNQCNSIQVNQGAITLMNTNGCLTSAGLTNITTTPVNLNPGSSITINQQPGTTNDSRDIWNINFTFNVSTTTQNTQTGVGNSWTHFGNAGYSGGYDPNTGQSTPATVDYQPTPFVTTTVNSTRNTSP